MPPPRQERPFSEKLKAFFRVGRSQGFPRPGEDTLVGAAAPLHPCTGANMYDNILDCAASRSGPIRTLPLRGISYFGFVPHLVFKPQVQSRYCVIIV